MVLFIPQHQYTLSGFFLVPGDKSISHRVLILGALRRSPLKILNLNLCDDVQKTQDALTKLGCHFDNTVMTSPHFFKNPSSVLDMGNSGTSARLLIGLLSRQAFSSTLSGDASLSKRPMKRVCHVLTHFASIKQDYLPLTINPHQKLKDEERSIFIETPSAQVKSSALIAAVLTKGKTYVEELFKTRPHTEDMMIEWDFPIKKSGKGYLVEGPYQGSKTPLTYNVPADPSAAAFGLVAGLICKQSSISVKNILNCHHRLKYLEILEKMGARFIKNNDIITSYSSDLHGIEVEASLSPYLIDEYPILAIAAAHAKGITRFCGVKELRYKESNRIESILQNLKKFGIECSAQGDDVTIIGQTFSFPSSVSIDPSMDHRIALSFAILGLSLPCEVIIKNAKIINTSFPEFLQKNYMNLISSPLLTS